MVLKSIAELPRATRWVAMVQREVAERLAATPGSRSYGATSVLAGLSCEVVLQRRIARTVFHPVPGVESTLLVLRRRHPPPEPQLAALVHAAFAHRRKALAGSLALAPGAPDDLRERVHAALEATGQAPDARGERLSPADFRRLADRLGPATLEALRAAAPRR